MAEQPIIAYARDYISVGHFVVPLIPNGKLIDWSLFPEGYRDYEGLTSLERGFAYNPTLKDVRRWLKKSPEMNLGILTGYCSGLLVVDVDGYNKDWREALKAQGKDALPTVQTRRGQHIYFQGSCRLQPITNAGFPFPHVDLRFEGAHVVAPPSVVYHEGYGYHEYVENAAWRKVFKSRFGAWPYPCDEVLKLLNLCSTEPETGDSGLYYDDPVDYEGEDDYGDGWD